MCWEVAKHRHIINLILTKSVCTPQYCVLSREAANINLIVFGVWPDQGLNSSFSVLAHKLLVRMSILQQQKWIKIGCKIRKFKVLNLALVGPFWLSLSWKPSEIEAICQPILPEAQFFNMKSVFYFRFQWIYKMPFIDKYSVD